MIRKNIADKVRKLLAQAEDPAATELEAQKFAAKAADLMARYELDEAMVRADKGRQAEAIETLTFPISGQGYHGKWRGELVLAVVEAYGCKMVVNHNNYNGDDRYAFIVGTKTALAALEILLLSVITQAELNAFAKTREYMATLGEFETPAKKNIARRDFFRSYLVGYGRGVGRKITATRTKIRKDYADTPGALILVDDKKRVADKFEELFPKTDSVRGAKHNIDGFADGLRDGQNADTGEPKVTTKNSKRITSKK